MSEVLCSLKQWSINLEQILFLLHGYYFNFYAKEMRWANYHKKNPTTTKKQNRNIAYLQFNLPVHHKIFCILVQVVTSYTTWPCGSLGKPVLFQNEKAIFLGFIIFSNSQPSFLIFRCILNPSCNVLTPHQGQIS